MRLTSLDHLLRRVAPRTCSVHSYDLRAVRTVRWCTDTWDGSTAPINGIVWDSVYCGHTCIGSAGRVFHDGSRESRAQYGSVRLAAMVADLAEMHSTLIAAIDTVVRGEAPHTTVESTLSPVLTELYLTHPSYRKLLAAATHPQSSVVVAYDETSYTWTIRRPAADDR